MQENEIIVNLDGNLTVIGAQAHKFYFANKCDIPASMRSADNPNTAFVVEVDGALRAAQATRNGAEAYMSDERILITRETVTLTDKQLAEMRQIKGYFPYRIIYGAINPQTNEFVASAVPTMRIPNKLKREGWTVFLLQAN